MGERVLIALGGNAMTGPDGSASPDEQRRAVEGAMRHVAALVAEGHRVTLTHGNGPQVGNLLLKNQLAADVVPPVPLDWCGAQTQATIGTLILNALGDRAAVVVTRTLVDPTDPAFADPVKPIGRYFGEAEARRFERLGQTWRRYDRGWRRVVASPEPLEILDAPAVTALIDAGFTVVAAGGGGVPVARDAAGRLTGVEAVIDKDLAAAALARAVRTTVLVIATDVPHAVVGFGTPSARPLGRVTTAELRVLHAAGHFAGGSMGPKVEAALRFVERGGDRSVITSLEDIGAALTGETGTVVRK
ncbi:carbamate kinase [Streptosporangium becharense]|uniref:Carbamate kinase n=1 Tax=Streptosporangium becharense TaxID=1816182 RepID=A0A7W9IKX9_9ACTN|nr:carbamate kinase [Streptosporangium becharense]MBB2911671.1 carbamate kinase [Streptosporangium becharense]MBB5822511.1 carbamate kinase [Streptosporangium becharense]